MMGLQHDKPTVPCAIQVLFNMKRIPSINYKKNDCITGINGQGQKDSLQTTERIFRESFLCLFLSYKKCVMLSI